MNINYVDYTLTSKITGYPLCNAGHVSTRFIESPHNYAVTMATRCLA